MNEQERKTYEKKICALVERLNDIRVEALELDNVEHERDPLPNTIFNTLQVLFASLMYARKGHVEDIEDFNKIIREFAEKKMEQHEDEDEDEENCDCSTCDQADTCEANDVKETTEPTIEIPESSDEWLNNLEMAANDFV